jgi:hypothetical protein
MAATFLKGRRRQLSSSYGVSKAEWFLVVILK